MDNDATTASSRPGRQRRRLIAAVVGAAVIAGAVIVGGTWQHSQNATSGALGANVCPTIDTFTGIPSIAPAAEVDWSGCNLTGAKVAGAYLWGANLSNANLTNANLTGANLNGASLTGANLTGATLTNANLIGVISGGIIGTPTLPTGWILFTGYLMGPGANLTGATLKPIAACFIGRGCSCPRIDRCV